MEIEFTSNCLQLNDADNLGQIQPFIMVVGVLQANFLEPFVL